MRKTKTTRYLLVFILLAAFTNSHAQDVDSNAAPSLPDRFGEVHVTATIDTARMVVGDRHTLRITVEPVGSSVVTFPTLEELTSGAIEALEIHVDTLRDPSGTVRRLEQQVTLTSFDEGVHPINNIVVHLHTLQGDIALAPTEKLFLNVGYVAEADTNTCVMKADEMYYNEPPTFREVMRWPLLGLLVAAVIAAIIWIVKRRKANKPVFVLPKAKPVPADKRALSELESLRRKELWQKGLIKRYYTDMTDIVRRYLRNMYGIKAGEMTSRQTLRAFHGIADWTEESETLLRQLLQKADMVKFAKSTPESYEHDQAMQFAVDFVRSVAATHRANNPEEGGNK